MIFPTSLFSAFGNVVRHNPMCLTNYTDLLNNIFIVSWIPFLYHLVKTKLNEMLEGFELQDCYPEDQTHVTTNLLLLHLLPFQSALKPSAAWHDMFCSVPTKRVVTIVVSLEANLNKTWSDGSHYKFWVTGCLNRHTSNKHVTLQVNCINKRQSSR